VGGDGEEVVANLKGLLQIGGERLDFTAGEHLFGDLGAQAHGAEDFAGVAAPGLPGEVEVLHLGVAGAGEVGAEGDLVAGEGGALAVDLVEELEEVGIQAGEGVADGAARGEEFPDEGLPERIDELDDVVLAAGEADGDGGLHEEGLEPFALGLGLAEGIELAGEELGVLVLLAVAGGDIAEDDDGAEGVALGVGDGGEGVLDGELGAALGEEEGLAAELDGPGLVGDEAGGVEGLAGGGIDETQDAWEGLADGLGLTPAGEVGGDGVDEADEAVGAGGEDGVADAAQGDGEGMAIGLGGGAGGLGLMEQEADAGGHQGQQGGDTGEEGAGDEVVGGGPGGAEEEGDEEEGEGGGEDAGRMAAEPGGEEDGGEEEEVGRSGEPGREEPLEGEGEASEQQGQSIAGPEGRAMGLGEAAGEEGHGVSEGKRRGDGIRQRIDGGTPRWNCGSPLPFPSELETVHMCPP